MERTLPESRKKEVAYTSGRPEERFSQSDPQDYQVLYSMEIIKPHYYIFWGTSSTI